MWGLLALASCEVNDFQTFHLNESETINAKQALKMWGLISTRIMSTQASWQKDNMARKTLDMSSPEPIS